MNSEQLRRYTNLGVRLREEVPQFSLFTELLKPYYDVPGRHYHTWLHVMGSMEFYLDNFGPLEFPSALALAGHDAIYVPGYAQNEEASAQLVERLFSDYPQEAIAAGDLIRATVITNHLDTGFSTIEEARILDADLAAMSEPYEQFLEWQRAVQMEVGCHTVEQKAFLLKFLRKGEIYRTPQPADRIHELNERALNNLSRFINS